MFPDLEFVKKKLHKHSFSGENVSRKSVNYDNALLQQKSKKYEDTIK